MAIQVHCIIILFLLSILKKGERMKKIIIILCFLFLVSCTGILSQELRDDGRYYVVYADGANKTMQIVFKDGSIENRQLPDQYSGTFSFIPWKEVDIVKMVD